MAFKYKDKKEFVELTNEKKCYYLARLYIATDRAKSTLPYKQRLFTCVNYLRKQPVPLLSILYNWLTDNTHQGLMIWDIVPKAMYYDIERRQEEKKEQNVKQYETFNTSMLDDILG